MCRSVPIRPASATGTSGTKTHRQPHASATNPPIVGPIACPMPFTDAHRPTAPPRRSPANNHVNSPITAGPRADAAMPPRQRHMMSSSSVGAVAAPTAHTMVPTIDAQ